LNYSDEDSDGTKVKRESDSSDVGIPSKNNNWNKLEGWLNVSTISRLNLLND